MGETTVYTLNPEDCYEFALCKNETAVERRIPKAEIKIEDGSVSITYHPQLSTKSRSLSSSPTPFSSLLSPKSLSPLHSPKRPKSDDNAYHFDTMSTHSEISLSGSPMSIGEHLGICPMERRASEYRLPDYYKFQHNHISCSSRELYQDENEVPPAIPHPDLLSLSEVAYCVTVPYQSNLFLLTFRGTTGLVCKAFRFSNKNNAEQLKTEFANQFQNACAMK